jgi:hypothetical protein
MDYYRFAFGKAVRRDMLAPATTLLGAREGGS